MIFLALLLACYPGFCAEEGFWTGWCVDECRNFRDGPDATYGVMGSNADGSRPIGETPAGFFSFEFRTATASWPTGGGTHLAGPMSGAPHWEGIAGYQSWLKPDIATKPCGIRIDTYNYNEGGKPWYIRNGQLDPVVDIWCPGVPLPAPGTWGSFRIEWTRLSTEFVRYRVAGQVRVVRIHPLSRNPTYIGFGNMDGLANHGGVPEIHFRNVQWGELPVPVEPSTWGRIKSFYRPAAYDLTPCPHPDQYGTMEIGVE